MKKNRLYTLLALLVILFWGTTFVSTKILLTRLSPVQIMLLRYLIAYAALLVIHPKFHRPEGLRQELCCIAAALCGSTLYFLAENTALSYTQASNVSLLISAAPILTSVVAHLFTRDERLTRHAFYGFFLAMAGIFLVVFNGRFVLKLSPAGDLLALAAALSWAFYTVILRKIDSRYQPVYITRRIFFYSIVTMLPCLLFDSTPFDPAVLRLPVLLGEGVDGQAHGGQLHPADLVVDLLGDVVDLLLQLSGVLGHPLQGQGLDGEGHVHNLRRVAVARRQVDQAALGQHVEGAAVGQAEALDVLPAGEALHRQLAQALHVHLAVEVAGVAQDGVVLHHLEVALHDHVLAAGGGDEDVPVLGRLVHGHDPEVLHGGLQGLEGVHLGDDHVGPHALGPHGDALAAPAVAGHHHRLARHHQVGGVHDGVPGGLPGAVLVVVVVLRLGIVHRHHGAGEDTRPLPGV